MFSQKLPSGLRSIKMLENRVPVDRLAVGGQAHQLVFAAVDLEAAVIGERRVEQAQGMREIADDASASSLLPAPVPKAGGAPFADAVQGEDGRFLEGLGKKALAAWLSW